MANVSEHRQIIVSGQEEKTAGGCQRIQKGNHGGDNISYEEVEESAAVQANSLEYKHEVHPAQSRDIGLCFLLGVSNRKRLYPPLSSNERELSNVEDERETSISSGRGGSGEGPRSTTLPALAAWSSWCALSVFDRRMR